MKSKLDFLVVGSQKAGTSALNNYLRDHAEIGMPKKKELHFFDNESNFENGVDYERYHKNFGNADVRIRGECTPVYMYWRASMRRIYEYSPEVKIIAILRNPIDRAYSHWNMEQAREFDDMDFSTAIRQEAERSRESLPLQHRVYSYTDRGFYTEQIRNIWRFFPKSQTLFLKSDDLKSKPEAVLEAVADFLGVSRFENVEKRVVSKRKYKSSMSPEDHAFLSDLYIHEIEQLEHMLGWDCSNWKNVRTRQGQESVKHLLWRVKNKLHL